MVVDHIIHLAGKQIANPSESLAIYSMLDLTFKVAASKLYHSFLHHNFLLRLMSSWGRSNLA